MTVRILRGDCLDVLRTLPADSVHCAVTDPPYELGFMGRRWDSTGVAFRPETWRAVLRVLKPGGYMVAFASTRGYHRMVCAIEDAGFVIHPMLAWITGQGFPKASRVQCEGTEGLRYGLQALKPAIEPICMAQKPMQGTGTQNWLAHGTGALNVDACRVAIDSTEREVIDNRSGAGESTDGWGHIGNRAEGERYKSHTAGRWPANVLHDGSDEVEAAFAAFGERTTGDVQSYKRANRDGYSGGMPECWNGEHRGDTGSASRFFFSAKASAADRADSKHPTVKPVALLRWLVRLVCPPGGTVLDPFAGSGTTGEAAMLEGFDALLIERDEQHADDIAHRIKRWSGADLPLLRMAAAD